MVHRASTVSMTVTIDVKALLYVDEYAQKYRYSRSGAVNELLRLARAYLKVLDVPDDEKGGEVLETPSILIEKKEKMVGHVDEWFEKRKHQAKLENKPRKRTKKAKTPKG